jgi:thioesterase domain-containing protein
VDQSGRELLATLAGAAPADQQALLLDTVRAEIARTLAFASVDEVAPEADLGKIGFTSISALALRNRLAELTGLDLPTGVVLDHPTPAKLAGHLRAQLRTGTAVPAQAGTTSPSTVSALYRDARDRGLIAEANALVAAAAKLRLDTADPARLRGNDAVRLARGPEGLARLVCLPPFAPVRATLQFQGFAAALQGVRDVDVLALPGFADGELLPADVAALTEAQAGAVRRTAGEAPYVLVGYSSGGALAHAVTGRLEAAGSPPQALVLLDAYVIADMSDQLVRALDYEVMERRARFAAGDFPGLTAMRRYLGLFQDWQPDAVATHTLFVRPADRIPGIPGEPHDGSDWRSTWKHADEFIEVAGDHCSLMSEHAGSTAQTVQRWLTHRQNGRNR